MGTLVKTKMPTTIEIYLRRGNQTRPQGINNTSNPLCGVGMAQNQPPLHYPAMLNPYPIYQNPVPGAGDHLPFEPDKDSASPSPSEFSNRSDIVTNAVAGR